MSDSWPDEVTTRIASEIKRLRSEVLDISGQALSDRTDKLGHRVSRSTISEIESGRRKSITVADLVILAAALDTVPIALIYPGPYDADIRALPKAELPQIWAVRWFAGELRTISEVPFDSKGHTVRIPHPKVYRDNLEDLENARAAAQLHDRKATLWRELNRLRRQKMSGEREVSDDEIRNLEYAIADMQDQINYHLSPADWALDNIAKQSSELWPDGWDGPR